MPNAKNTYVNMRWALLIEERGGRCAHCELTYDLEFAHVQPTECVGRGRGKSRRLSDILQHPTHYLLLCRGCHDDLDGRPRRRWKGEPR